MYIKIEKGKKKYKNHCNNYGKRRTSKTNSFAVNPLLLASVTIHQKIL